MDENLKEKRLYVLKLKLKKVQSQRGFFIKNFIKVLLSIIGISLYVSFFTDIYSKQDMINVTKGKILYELIFTSTLCVFFSVLAHFIWGIQDRMKIIKLKEEIDKLEKEILS